MYSYEARMRAVKLYIKYAQRPAATIRELGYPSRGMLRSWYREFAESGDLHQGLRRRPRYSNEEKQRAVEYYWVHDRSVSRTVSVLGYPHRETLRRWIDELMPGVRNAPIRSGHMAMVSEEQKREAVIELCSRETSAASVADAFGVSRVSLYKWKHELLGNKGRLTVKDPDDRDELAREVESLRKRIHRLRLEHDILNGANELLKKDQGISPQILTNREKALLIDALRPTYKLSVLLECQGAATSTTRRVYGRLKSTLSCDARSRRSSRPTSGATGTGASTSYCIGWDCRSRRRSSGGSWPRRA